MDRPKLGELRTLTGQVVKARHGERSTFVTRFVHKRISPIDGVYIGYRVLHEGHTHTENEYGEYGVLLSSYQHFERTRTTLVWVFAVDERKLPIFVLPDDACDFIPF
jgi:hypothetical protein